METEAPGLPVLNKEEEWSQPIASGIEKFKAMMSIVDPPLQFEASLKNKIGSIDYELIKL